MEDAAAPDASRDAPMETDAAGAPAAAAAAGKKKIKKIDVPLKAEGVNGYSKKQLDDYFEKEGQLQLADKLMEETNERKNALEAYVYSLR